jgi:signal transduction histidine kinase
MTPDIEEKLNNGESFTTKPTGNGIGASTSYDIIKNMHGGHIKYSAQDKGAIITVQL